MKTKSFVTNVKDLSYGIQNTVPADDNVKQDMTKANPLIQTMKLSLLLEGCMRSKQIINYLKTDAMSFPLPYDLAECDPQHQFLQRAIDLVFGTIDEGSPWQIKKSYSTLNMIQDYVGYKSGNGISPGYGYLPPDIQQKYFAKHPLFELFRKISPYNTLASASHFFGISSMAFDPITKGLQQIRPTIFTNAEENMEYWNSFKARHPTHKNADLIEFVLREIIDRIPNRQCYGLYSKVFEANQKQVYDFNNKEGLTFMKMLKAYEYTPTGMSKSYIPLTNWMFHGEPQDRLFTIPLPTQQPLYNLQDFKDCEYVVICPNIEIADKLQRENQFENVVFTSFVCNRGYYNQVDFSELEGKKVVLLIVNHSGMEVEDAVVESKPFYTYLREQEKKLKYAKLSVIQMAVEYSLSGANIPSMSEYIARYKEPESFKNSTFIFDTDEAYEANFREAEDCVRMRNQEPKPYWVKDTNHETVNDTDKKDEPKKIEQLLRGIIARGCITYFIGESGIGKTNITASFCAYLVNNSERAPRPFAERFWTRCKIESEYERLKIVHLDFDNDEGYISQRDKNFVDPYMPDDPEECKACKENYIVRCMLGKPINYSVEENFPAFCELLDNIAENEGVKGQPIDVLVIDTYWAFVHGNDTKFDVFRNLISSYPDMAIIVLHHLNNGESYGRKDKLFEADTTIKLWRDRRAEEGECTLHIPFTVQIGNKHRMIQCDEDLKPFQAKLDENNHFIMIDPEHSEIEMLKILRKSYKDLTQKELADLLGMSVNTLANKLKK